MKTDKFHWTLKPFCIVVFCLFSGTGCQPESTSKSTEGKEILKGNVRIFRSFESSFVFESLTPKEYLAGIFESWVSKKFSRLDNFQIISNRR